MKIPDPVSIGWPKHEEPRVLGTLSGHGLGDLLIGHRVIYETMEGEAEFSVNFSFVPGNPKRERLVVILVPERNLPSDLWDCVGFELAESKPKTEEYPF